MRTVAELPLRPSGHTVIQASELEAADGPVVLVLPALGIPAGYYGPFVDALGSEGVTAAVVDYPGQGESRPRIERGVDYGYGDLMRDWFPLALAAVRQEWPGRPVVVVGHSLGGHIALGSLALDQPEDVHGVVLIGSGTPFWRTHLAPVPTLLKTTLVRFIARAAGYWPGHRFGFGGRQPLRLMTEWSHFAGSGRLEPDRLPAVEHGFAGVRVPVLAIDLDNDDLAPPRAVDHLVGKLTGTTVERWHFAKGPEDPGRPVDHYSFARSPEIITARVADWVVRSTVQH